MRPINRASLPSLYFDGADAALWHLPPHADIWGQDPSYLPASLHKYPDKNRLERVLLASHLLFPKATPLWATSWLEQTSTSLLAAKLLDLHSALWRLVSVPVAAHQQSQIHLFLIGAGHTLSGVKENNHQFLAPDSLDALEIVRKLVRKNYTQNICFLFLGSSQGIAIQGQSLGLPCYLGARAAAENLPLPDHFLATGAVQADGQILPVQHLTQKINAAQQDLKLFLYPAGSQVLSDIGEYVAVANVNEAFAVVACYQPGLALKIAHIERALSLNLSMARELCSLRRDLVGWVRRNRQRLTQALHNDLQLEELVTLLKIWTDTTRRVDMELGRAVLDCICPQQVQKLCTDQPRLAWDLCTLQMNKANHSGSLQDFEPWARLAKGVENQVSQDDDGVRLVALHTVQQLISHKHNRYDFFTAPLDSQEQEYLAVLEKEHERRCQQYGPCSNLALGQIYGTLGQHYAFQGPTALDKAMYHLERAISYFAGSNVEQDRDRLYQVFALSAAEQGEQALSLMQVIQDLWDGNKWNLCNMNPYQVHALVRLYVDAGQAIDSALWNELYNKLLANPAEHPWQLIAYNLGLLAPTVDQAHALLRQSLGLCQGIESGPTIQIMALLPLAQLFNLNPDEDFSRAVGQAMKPLVHTHDKQISTTHFAPLLAVSMWQGVLRQVQALRKDLFPFTYR